MTTFIVLFILGSLLLLGTAYIGYLRSQDAHKVDLMAGDGGED